VRNQRGFTFAELMVVIAIIAITAAIAIPNYISWLPKRRLQSAVSDMQATMQLARLTAVKENKVATLTFDIANESYRLSVAGRTVKSGGMPAGIDLASVFLKGTETSATSVNFDSKGLANPEIDVRLQNSQNKQKLIQLNLTGNSRID
jgi:prepilin-type N-terminal cleavage/methylation domain-containing protein